MLLKLPKGSWTDWILKLTSEKRYVLTHPEEIIQVHSIWYNFWNQSTKWSKMRQFQEKTMELILGMSREH
ncbi:hypothetical protein RRG08_016149 [Elysia crispata]|uniref:Uncharacterized protein n=1 Tax=Elysia crispata TaxID=231223 RepID=A0AAE1D915_9GAST|nr:hypothetical protein RRG08_016149 [Elysia crispata]